MKRILINAMQPEELRIAFVDGQKLEDLEIEPKASASKKGNIYKGTVVRIEKGLDAAFIDYGDEKHGFLPFKNISAEYLKDPESQQNLSPPEALRRNQSLLVQVQLVERGNKGALLTNKISLAGHNIVLMPNNPDCGGVSRRTNDEQRQEARKALDQIDCHDNEGVILRTSGAGKSSKEIHGELDSLRRLWDKITRTAAETSRPLLIYQERGVLLRNLRDRLHDDIGEIIIDDKRTYEEALDFAKLFVPNSVSKIKLHQETTPLFNVFQLEQQINQAFEREVPLPSGGTLVFDRTEAMISIDINSAKHIRQAGIEATALSVNLEACDEIARQLRLRDIGGLIVIDFIDMESSSNRRTVEQRLTQAMSVDRARKRIGTISKFGLLEMSRQRLRSSLDETNYITCPRCDGNGVVRTTQSAALAALRVMEDEAAKEKTVNVYATLPAQMVEFLINAKREELNGIEQRYGVKVFIATDHLAEVPHFKVVRQRADEPKPSMKIKSRSEGAQHDAPSWKSAEASARAPAIQSNYHSPKASGKVGGLWRAIRGLLGNVAGKLRAESEQPAPTQDRRRRSSPSRDRRSRRRQGDNRGGARRAQSGDRSRGGRNGYKAERGNGNARGSDRSDRSDRSGQRDANRGGQRRRSNDDNRRAKPQDSSRRSSFDSSRGRKENGSDEARGDSPRNEAQKREPQRAFTPADKQPSATPPTPTAPQQTEPTKTESMGQRKPSPPPKEFIDIPELRDSKLTQVETKKSTETMD